MLLCRCDFFSHLSMLQAFDLLLPRPTTSLLNFRRDFKYMWRYLQVSGYHSYCPLTYYQVSINTIKSFPVTRVPSLFFTCVLCVCFFPSILDIKFVGRTSRGHTGGRSHRIFNPPSFCGACLDFCREKDSAILFPRRP